MNDEPELHDDAVIGRAVRWSLIAVGVIAVVAAIAFVASRRQPVVPQATAEPGPAAAPLSAAVVRAPPAEFADITREAGITFVHANGATGEKLLPETMGGGVAFLDFDNDGDEDLLFVDGRAWPWSPASRAPQRTSTLVLYQNDGHGRFTDVSAASGLASAVYGMGVAAGDYDGDGWTDVFVTGVGGARLFRNTKGHFRDVTAEAGVGGSPEAWSTCAAWLDFDNDGGLDLFVCHYVRWTRAIDLAQDFKLTGIGRAYGPPRTFEGAFPTLYRNDGRGRFTDVSAAAGVQVKNASTGVPLAKSLGVAVADLDADGYLDLTVANDTVPNLVFHNQRDGSFREVGASTGMAFDSYGAARSAMGIDAADFRNDGSLGVAIGNFANEMTALYVSQGAPLQFADEAILSGIGPPSRSALTFGVLFTDYDLDGRLDLVTANGHIESEINTVQASQHYEQPPQLFWNAGPASPATFVDVSLAPGSGLGKPMVARGVAGADIDGDGDIDLVFTSVAGPPRLLRNDQRLGHHWLRLALTGKDGNRDAIGAVVEVKAGGQTIRRAVMPVRGYLSQSEPTITVGLGAATTVDSVTVRWPGGATEEIPVPPLDRLTRVSQK